MIKTIPHFFEIDSEDSVNIDLLTEYFDTNQYNDELLCILLIDLSFLGPNTEINGDVEIESIEKGERDIYHLNYLIPYHAFNGCKDIDVNDTYEVTLNFTIDKNNLIFDVIETERVYWHDDI